VNIHVVATNPSATNSAPSPGSDDIATREFLTFRLGPEEYGIGIGRIPSGERERMLILMDIEKLMSSADMGLISEAIQ
jgi:chemotaxis signal transduction protein